MDRVTTKLRYRGRTAYLYLPASLTRDSAFPRELKGEKMDELDVVVCIEGDKIVVRREK